MIPSSPFISVSLITKNGGIRMITNNFTCESLFKDYFIFWIKLYKEGAVRPVTLEKYWNNQRQIARIIPELQMKDFDRIDT